MHWGGGGVTPWITHQGMIEALNYEGADASLLAQQLDGRMASSDYLLKAAQVCLDCIPSADEALCNLGTFAFVASHLFSTEGKHTSAVTKLLSLIGILEELHFEVHEMITTPYLATTLLYAVSRQWLLCLNSCVTALSSENIGTAGTTVPFSLDTILLKMEGGHYVGPLLPLPLTELVSGRCDGSNSGNAGGGDTRGVSGSSGNMKDENREVVAAAEVVVAVAAAAADMEERVEAQVREAPVEEVE